jgi:hypothetical protein
MNDLQKRIDYLIDIEKNINFALQDKNFNEFKKANCVLYPMKGAKYVQNAEEIRKELVPYLASRPPQKYILHYSRQLISRNTEHEIIDTRPSESQNQNLDTLQDMDERNKEERRSDELYIREILSKNGFLESEVARLKDKIEELEGMLEDAESEAEENKNATMADATTSTIGQVAQLIPTLLDKYFAIQEQKNALLAEQIRRQAPPRPQPTQNQTFEQPVNGFYYEGEN